MPRCFPRVVLALSLLAFTASAAGAADCLECHGKITPGIVNDWKASRHAGEGVGCPDCHGGGHKGADDVKNVAIPTPDTCGKCHEERVAQYKSGKHAVAWAAMKAMPSTHYQPMTLIEGLKGCGGCHKIGMKTEEEIRGLKEASGGFGIASCDACHTRHSFSVKEARQPQACQTCHMGFDHPQWEMYSSSKHGVRHLLKQSGVLADEIPAPTCQSCHMPEGNHSNHTAWGFLAVRLPMPADNQWAADRATILQALGVLDPDGKPTDRLEVVKAADVARLTQEAWQKERDRMLKTCNGCHSGNFAKVELEKGDRMIRESDRLMAESIRTVAGLYRDGLLPKPAAYRYPFPDLLTFLDAPTVVEQKLFVMFLEHRMRAFQGSFHMNPDYAFWYGWGELVRDAAEIREEAAGIRESHGKASGK